MYVLDRISFTVKRVFFKESLNFKKKNSQTICLRNIKLNSSSPARVLLSKSAKQPVWAIISNINTIYIQSSPEPCALYGQLV